MESKKYPIQLDGENLEATYSDLVEVIERFYAMTCELEMQRCKVWSQMSQTEKNEWRDGVQERVNEIIQEQDRKILNDGRLPF